VNSLGDGPAVLGTSRDPASGQPRARLLAAGAVIADTDPAQARATALALADEGADWLKLRVDDNLGATAKMPWEAVQAVIDAAGERGLRVATHLFYLEDAKRLLEMGTGLIAHSVRDADVDDAFIAALGESGVCYVPTLVREVSTFVYATRPTFFDDPFFQRYAKASEVERLSAPAFMEEVSGDPSAARYRVALLQAMRNLLSVHGAGIPIAFGTDSGPAARFPGYFEHMELSLMVGAGLTPEQALRSATGVAAACLGLDDRGTLEAGKWADFLVLAQNPLRNIEATRSQERVFVGGEEVPQGEAVATDGGPRR
jgi:imidazolonepropionase-like amidohydrolase